MPIPKSLFYADAFTIGSHGRSKFQRYSSSAGSFVVFFTKICWNEDISVVSSDEESAQ